MVAMQPVASISGNSEGVRPKVVVMECIKWKVTLLKWIQCMQRVSCSGEAQSACRWSPSFSIPALVGSNLKCPASIFWSAWYCFIIKILTSNHRKTQIISFCMMACHLHLRQLCSPVIQMVCSISMLSLSRNDETFLEVKL